MPAPLALLLALTLTASAHASPRTDAAQRLAQAERQRAAHEGEQAAAERELQAAQAQAARLADERVYAAAALRVVEDGVVAAADRLAAATLAQGEAEAALKARAAAFSALVPLMLRMARYPAETVLAVPAPPDQALEGLLVARGIAAALNHEAAALLAAQARSARLTEDTAREAATLAAQRARQAVAAAALEQAVALANTQVSVAEAAQLRAARIVAGFAAQARTLRGAIAAMDAAQAQAQAQTQTQTQARPGKAVKLARPLGQAESAALGGSVGQMVTPVAGPVVRPFGAPAEDGPAIGVTYGVAPGAYVSSPCSGQVAFAAPFRSYGQLIILECGGGYDVVLAGLGRIDAPPGRTVRAGEPLGRMPEFDPDPSNARRGHPTLYVELRSRGEPVDPAPFLNAKG